MKHLAAVMTLLWLAGCAGVPVVPSDLKEKVDRKLSFQQVKDAPQSYKGTLLVLGGMVLSAKTTKQNGTRIEILQLPLDDDDEPIGRLTESKGRFLAQHKEFLDPAAVPAGTLLTVVGEVTGSAIQQLDEIEYQYPTVEILSMTVWPPGVPAWWGGSYPYTGAYWGSYGRPPHWIPWPVEKR